MVRRVLSAMLLVSAAVPGCQTVAGIDDRELDPTWGQPAVGNTRAPPERPAGTVAPGGGDQRRFIVRTVYLGTVDPQTDVEDSTAWRRIGYDLDGKCTTAEQSKSNSSGVCNKVTAAQEMALEDGDDCRDNAGGRLMAFSTQFLATGFEKKIQNELDDARVSSLMLQLDDLGEGPDDPYVPGRLYTSVPRPKEENSPIWNGSDEFYADTGSVESGDLLQPKYVFARGYLRGNVWVSGDLSDKPSKMPMMFYDRFLEVEPEAVVLTLELDEHHDKVKRSVLAAVMNVPRLTTVFLPVFYESICSMQTATAMVYTVVAPNADLMSGSAPFVAPTKTCDAMSLGWMLRWEPFRRIVGVGTSPPRPSACGTEDGGAAGAAGASGDAGTDAAPQDAGGGQDAGEAGTDA